MTNLSYGIFFAEQPIILMVPLRLKDRSTDLDVSKEVSLAVLVNHVSIKGSPWGRLHKHATKLTRKMRSSYMPIAVIHNEQHFYGLVVRDEKAADKL